MKTAQAPEEQNDELYLPDQETDEPEDNISPAVRELMAKYVPFNHAMEGSHLNSNAGLTTPSQIMNE